MAPETTSSEYGGAHRAEAAGERTIGQLVADVTYDIQAIVRGEIALAKAELRQGAKVMGKGAALVGAGVFLGLLGVIFLFHTISQVIAIWLPLWAGYLITTVFLLLVAAILARSGAAILKKARPAPDRAIAGVKETVAAIRP